MYTYAFEKYASPSGAPLWVQIPGTPLTLPGRQTQYDRLPGMTDWAPQPVISRVAQGLEDEIPLEEIAKREGGEGLGAAVGTGLLGGSIAGGLAGRLLSGEAGVAPLKQLLKKGLTREAISELRRIPKGMLATPLIGAGIGTAAGLAAWKATEGGREQQARDVARGLLTERILQRHQLREATRDIADPSRIRRFSPLAIQNFLATVPQRQMPSGVQTAVEPEAHRSVLGGGNA